MRPKKRNCKNSTIKVKNRHRKKEAKINSAFKSREVRLMKKSLMNIKGKNEKEKII